MNALIKQPFLTEPTKDAFLKTWPGGYLENWVVFGKQSGVTEQKLVFKCLLPFANPDGVAMEIGCGQGFWVKNYLSKLFKSVVALDLLRSLDTGCSNVQYIEVPDRNYDCFGVEDASVDFVWSFGCFCHLTIPSIQKYLDSAFKKLLPGGKAALYFSNTERRPNTATVSANNGALVWVANNWDITKQMMEGAGFTKVYDLMPELPDTMAYGEKPL